MVINRVKVLRRYRCKKSGCICKSKTNYKDRKIVIGRQNGLKAIEKRGKIWQKLCKK
jgi:hypothetical protein